MNLGHIKLLLDVSTNPRLHQNELSATRFKLSCELFNVGLIVGDPYLRLTEKGTNCLVELEHQFNEYLTNHG